MSARCLTVLRQQQTGHTCSLWSTRSDVTAADGRVHDTIACSRRSAGHWAMPRQHHMPKCHVLSSRCFTTPTNAMLSSESCSPRPQDRRLLYGGGIV